eukprot:scaffold163782_cov32-Tisochrysis_lutea.AAC.1
MCIRLQSNTVMPAGKVTSDPREKTCISASATAAVSREQNVSQTSVCDWSFTLARIRSPSLHATAVRTRPCETHTADWMDLTSWLATFACADWSIISMRLTTESKSLLALSGERRSFSTPSMSSVGAPSSGGGGGCGVLCDARAGIEAAGRAGSPSGRAVCLAWLERREGSGRSGDREGKRRRMSVEAAGENRRMRWIIEEREGREGRTGRRRPQIREREGGAGEGAKRGSRGGGGLGSREGEVESRDARCWRLGAGAARAASERERGGMGKIGETKPMERGE